MPSRAVQIILLASIVSLVLHGSGDASEILLREHYSKTDFWNDCYKWGFFQVPIGDPNVVQTTPPDRSAVIVAQCVKPDQVNQQKIAQWLADNTFQVYTSTEVDARISKLDADFHGLHKSLLDRIIKLEGTSTLTALIGKIEELESRIRELEEKSTK